VSKSDVPDPINFVEKCLSLFGIQRIIDNKSSLVCTNKQGSIVGKIERVHFGFLLRIRMSEYEILEDFAYTHALDQCII